MASFELLRLPNELVSSVLEKVEKQSDLCAIARTCHRLQSLAESFMYQSVLLTKADGHSQTENLARALTSPGTPSRASLVRKLHVNKPQCLSEGDYEALPSVFPPLQNLHELVVEALPSTIFTEPARGRWMLLQERLRQILEDASLSRVNPEYQMLPCLRSCKSIFLLASW